MAQCECSGCREKFKSVYGFDKHQVGGYGDPIYRKGQVVGYTKPTRHCLTPEEMAAIGMSKNDKGIWITKAYVKSAHSKEGDEIEEGADEAREETERNTHALSTNP